MVSVRKRGKVYEYRFEIATVEGTRKWITKSGYPTKAEAFKEGAKAYNDFYYNGQKTQLRENMSYADFLDYWIDNYASFNLHYSTTISYINIIKNHVKPRVGFYKLWQLDTRLLQEFINKIYVEYGFSKNYMASILKVVKGSLKYACYTLNYINTNPAEHVHAPRIDKIGKDPAHIFTQEEIDLILNRFADNDTFTCVFLTSCYTGMRTGEVCALTWDDINLEKGIINIEHNVYDKPKDDKGRWFIGTTKTQTGTRKVHISQTLKIALQNYKNKQDYLKKLYGRKYIYYNLEDVENKYGKIVEHRIVREEISNKDSKRFNLIFTKENGAYIGTDITRYPYKIIHNELGIKKCRFYDLRGSYATKILNNGIEIRDVADLLGHKNIETTENFYISSTESSRKYATELFDNISKSETINKIIEYKIESQ